MTKYPKKLMTLNSHCQHVSISFNISSAHHCTCSTAPQSCCLPLVLKEQELRTNLLAFTKPQTLHTITVGVMLGGKKGLKVCTIKAGMSERTRGKWRQNTAAALPTQMGLLGHLLTREGSSTAVPTVPQACKAADAGLIKSPQNYLCVSLSDTPLST